MNVTIHIDGGSRGNPGPAAAGVYIEDAETGQHLHAAGYYLGRATNNMAEYRGLLHALDVAAELGAKRLLIRTDSQLMARQIRGEYRVKSDDLRPLFDQALKALSRFSQWRIEDIRRDHNKQADELVNKALDAKRDVVEISPRDAVPNAPAMADTANGIWFEAHFTTATGRRCPAPNKAGATYPVGPTMPAGLCVHAARTILDAGLLDAPGKADLDRRVRCAQCGAVIQLSAVDA